MVKIKLSPEVAAWMRPRIDLSGLDPPLAERARCLLDGGELSFGNVERISQSTRMPLGFFFHSSPPGDEDELLRDWDGYPSRAVVAVVQHMRWRQNIAADVNRRCAESPAWAAVHDMATLLPANISTVRDLIRALEAQDIMIMSDSTVPDEPDWLIDPAELSMVALYDNNAPLIWLHSCATGQAELLLRGATALLWRADDLVSVYRHGCEIRVDPAAAALMASVRDEPSGEYLSDRFWDLLRMGYDAGQITAVEAGRLTNGNWSDVLDRFDTDRKHAY